MSVFYDRFVAECEAIGGKPHPIGAKLKIHTSTITAWKQLGREPSSSDVLKLAEYFHTTTDYLLGITDDRRTVDDQLSDYAVGLWGGGGEMTEEMKKDILDYIKFKKQQKK